MHRPLFGARGLVTVLVTCLFILTTFYGASAPLI